MFTASYLGSLSSTTSVTLDHLASLSQSFRTVEAQTNAFQKQCEDLVTEQQRVTRLADQIGENLQYYNYLEPITRKLNAPGAGNFVRGKDFSDMLARLDECLEYMGAHVSAHLSVEIKAVLISNSHHSEKHLRTDLGIGCY